MSLCLLAAALVLAGCSKFPEQGMAGVHGLELRAPALAASQSPLQPVPRQVSETARIEAIHSFLSSLGHRFRPAQNTPMRPEVSCQGVPNYRFYMALDGLRLYVTFDRAIQQADLSPTEREDFLRLTGQPRDLMARATPEE